MALVIELEPSQYQTDLNLSRWATILEDPALAQLPYRIETDRHGHILMSPPPSPSHSKKQFRIGALLERFMPEGQVLTECPISNSDGIRAADVAWLAPGRGQETETDTPLLRAPEICVEVLSKSNTVQEMKEKVSLYFEAGAREVWICDLAGSMKFYLAGKRKSDKRSQLVTNFPHSA
jgi:Uma2 family endonuclease